MSVYLHLNFWNWVSHEVKWIFKTETVFSTQVGSQIAWIVSMGVALLSLSLGSCTLAKIPNPHLRVEFREKTETEEQIEELQEVSPMLTEWALTTAMLGLSVWTLPVSLTDSFVRRALFEHQAAFPGTCHSRPSCLGEYQPSQGLGLGYLDLVSPLSRASDYKAGRDIPSGQETWHMKQSQWVDFSDGPNGVPFVLTGSLDHTEGERGVVRTPGWGPQLWTFKSCIETRICHLPSKIMFG